MDSARKRAEDALAAIDAAIGDADETTPERVSLVALGPALCDLIRATRALLAAEPAKGAETHRPVLSVHGMHDTCDLCQRAIPDGCYAVFCGVCEDKLRAAFDGPPPVPIDPPAPPAGADVREAAEAAYAAWLMTVPVAFGDAMARLGAALRGGQKGEVG